jgi:DNA replication protein DnaC
VVHDVEEEVGESTVVIGWCNLIVSPQNTSSPKVSKRNVWRPSAMSGDSAGSVDAALRASELPAEKTLATLNRTLLPPKVAKQLAALCEGGFVERGENLLVFGLPGRGKSHVVAAVGHELIRRGYRVLFTPTFALVQRLLVANATCGSNASSKHSTSTTR